jgi:hypothetical protein
LTRPIVALVVVGAALTFGACSECAGTLSCTSAPLISHSGEFINHKTGAPVAGVQVEWVRTSGIEIDDDTIRATSDARGFFMLQTGSVYTGEASGDLRVTPPAPFQEYRIPNVTVSASTRRGDGGYMGRLVVDPFLIIVGEVQDLTTNSRVPDGTVRLRRIGGARADEDLVDIPLEGTRWYWIDPTIVDFGTGSITAEFEIRIPGDPRVFRTTDSVPLLYRDGEMAFVLLSIQT